MLCIHESNKPVIMVISFTRLILALGFLCTEPDKNIHMELRSCWPTKNMIGLMVEMTEKEHCRGMEKHIESKAK